MKKISFLGFLFASVLTFAQPNVRPNQGGSLDVSPYVLSLLDLDQLSGFQFYSKECFTIYKIDKAKKISPDKKGNVQPNSKGVRFKENQRGISYRIDSTSRGDTTTVWVTFHESRKKKSPLIEIPFIRNFRDDLFYTPNYFKNETGDEYVTEDFDFSQLTLHGSGKEDITNAGDLLVRKQ